MNQDASDMPVAVTWYDANAYAAWIQRKRKLPVRLLTVSEYKALIDSDPILKSLRSEWESYFSKCKRSEEEAMLLRDEKIRIPYKIEEGVHFFHPDGSEIQGRPPYMKEEAFQNLVCRYVSDLKWVKHEAGIRFLLCEQFSEWLNDSQGKKAAAAINTKRFTAAHSFFPVETDHFATGSTGKYKYQKIGFRLCYLASN